MKLANMTSDDRPRERLMRYGASSLMNEELLAILFGTGSTGINVIDMSRELLHCYGGLRGLSVATLPELVPVKKSAKRCYGMPSEAQKSDRPADAESFEARVQNSVKGFGMTKAITLLAALELGRRAAKASTGEETQGSLQRKLESWADELRAESREFIVAIYLDDDGDVIADDRISYGGLDGAVLDAPWMLRRALRLFADGVVLLHNHPSGSIQPSVDDMNLTRSLSAMLRVLKIGFRGHYITANGQLELIPGSDNA